MLMRRVVWIKLCGHDHFPLLIFLSNGDIWSQDCIKMPQVQTIPICQILFMLELARILIIICHISLSMDLHMFFKLYQRPVWGGIYGLLAAIFVLPGGAFAADNACQQQGLHIAEAEIKRGK